MAFLDLNLDIQTERYEEKSKVVEIEQEKKKQDETKATSYITKLIAS